MLEYQTVIYLVSGAIVMFLGIRLLLRKGEEMGIPEGIRRATAGISVRKEVTAWAAIPFMGMALY